MKPKKSKPTPAVICEGLFFIVTGDTACAHLIPEHLVTRFYDGVAIAEKCRDPEAAMQMIIRDTFRVKDARAALPAPSFDALAFYMEEYKGPAQDSVRVLAAKYVAGRPWDTSDCTDPGTHDRMPVKPKTPEGPAGVAEPDEGLDAIARLLEMVPA
jgi:hypothetical protein